MINHPYRAGETVSVPVAAKKEIERGALVALTAAGYALAATETTAIKVIGRADTYVDNSSGANGDVRVPVLRKRAFLFTNTASGADEIKLVHLMEPCYLIDDATVGATDDSGKRLEVGIVIEISDEGIWVEIA